MTAAAPARAPAASGDPGGRIPSAAPLPSPPGPTWGGGRREAGSPPRSNMAPPRRRPNRRGGYSRSPGGLGAGKCGGRAPSGRSAEQCSGPGSPRRPAAAATSGRALAGASPLPAAPPPRQARRARPGPSRPAAGSAPRSLGHAGRLRASPCPPSKPRGSLQSLPFKRPWIRPHAALSLGSPRDTPVLWNRERGQCGRDAAAVSPGASTCRARAARPARPAPGAELGTARRALGRGAQSPSCGHSGARAHVASGPAPKAQEEQMEEGAGGARGRRRPGRRGDTGVSSPARTNQPSDLHGIITRPRASAFPAVKGRGRAVFLKAFSSKRLRACLSDPELALIPN